ncbi:MAG: type I restriction enzyme S subunit [Cognaticolwellia sp.]|jgi:type I restriction enzyme S subunit
MYNRVDITSLSDRLDAEYYTEDQIQNLTILNSFGVFPFYKVCTSINVGYTGELTSQYTDKGTVLYRVSDIDGLFLKEDKVNYVPEYFAEENRQIWIKNGDVVLAAVGNTIGKVAIKSFHLPDGVCSRALMITRPIPEKIDSHFLVTYLSCKFAQKSLLRGISGSAQPVLNTPLISNLPIIQVNSIAQRYIGNKVRQAEILRPWEELLSKFSKFLVESLIQENINEEELITAQNSLEMGDTKPERNLLAKLDVWNTKYSNVTDKKNRMSFSKFYSTDELIDIIAAPSYSPELVSYCKKVEKYPKLGQFMVGKAKLGITGSIAKDYVTSDTPNAVPYISTKQVKGLFAYLDDIKYISAASDVEWEKCRINDGDIIINKSGNVGAAAILSCKPYIYINSVSDIINIRINDTQIDKAYLVEYLNSPYGQKQLQRLSGGAIFDHVSLHAIPEINIAVFDFKAQRYIGNKVRLTENIKLTEKSLMIASKALIEALIGGQITETQLIEAQQALEEGDDSKDRAILSKLTDKGYLAKDGTELFDDLDTLYELLDEAKDAIDSSSTANDEVIL